MWKNTIPAAHPNSAGRRRWTYISLNDLNFKATLLWTEDKDEAKDKADEDDTVTVNSRGTGIRT